MTKTPATFRTHLKALIALITPAVAVLYPMFVGGWDWKTDAVPALIALLVAYGVYKVPNAPAVSERGRIRG
jgi:CHASE2 domain-containing sensor protein